MVNDARYGRIRDMIRSIPQGSVASYGQIGQLVGIPRGARQVTYALRTVPDGESVPWHRVIRSSGHIAFDRGSASFKKQRKRLVSEGVIVKNGCIDMRRFRWQPDLDELLWKPDQRWEDA